MVLVEAIKLVLHIHRLRYLLGYLHSQVTLTRVVVVHGMAIIARGVVHNYLHDCSVVNSYHNSKRHEKYSDHEKGYCDTSTWIQRLPGSKFLLLEVLLELGWWDCARRTSLSDGIWPRHSIVWKRSRAMQHWQPREEEQKTSSRRRNAKGSKSTVGMLKRCSEKNAIMTEYFFQNIFFLTLKSPLCLFIFKCGFILAWS